MPEKLSLAAVRAACGARVLSRAEEILHSPLLFARTRCGAAPAWELFARCHGSQGEVYALRVRVEGASIGESHCSCRFDGGGLCKHRVALLLAQLHEPQSFAERPALAVMLGDYSPEALRDLVALMVRREPSLLSLLDAGRGEASGDELAVRAGLRRAFSGHDAADAAPTLERGFGEAARRETEADWFAAGTFYTLVLGELAHAAPRWEKAYDKAVEWGEGYHEEEWDFGEDWARQAVESLERCLNREDLAPDAKRRWTTTLWEAEQAARDAEYFSLPPLARDLLAAHAPDDLWGDIEAAVRAQLVQNAPKPTLNAYAMGRGGFVLERVAAGDDWERQRDVDFLVARLEARGRSNEVETLVSELGTTRQRFDVKLQKSDFEGAAQLAGQFYGDSWHHLLPCATALEEAGAGDLALQLVQNAEKRLESDPHSQGATWLADFYLNHKNAPDARRYALKIFAARPEIAANFARLRGAVELAGAWEAQRDDLETEAKTLLKRDILGNDHSSAIGVWMALHDGDARRAFDRLNKVPKKWRHRFLEAVATLGEADFPAESLLLWRELAEHHIENRDQNSARRSYQASAACLKRARALHQKLDTMEEWKGYLETLRGVYKTLRALQDELKKAGLC